MRPFTRSISNTRKTILLFAMCLPVLSSVAQVKDTASYSFTLQQSIDYALKNQVNVINAGYDEQIAKAKVNETIGIGLPQINGSIDFKDYFEIPIVVTDFFTGPFGTRYNTTVGIEASQLVFDGTYIVGLQASKTYLELSRKATKQTKIETVLNVTKAYYTVLVNEERKKLIEANVTRLKKLGEDTKALYDNGFVEKLDLDRITLLYNNIQVERQRVERLLGLGYTLLKFQMGMNQQAAITVTDKLSDINFDPGFSNDKFDYTNRAEYSLLQTQRDLTKLDLKKNRFGYLPNLALYGSVSRQAQRNKFDVFDSDKKWYPIGLIGIRLGVPIFDGLQKNYRIQQSRLSVMKVENNLKNLEHGIDLELANAKILLENSASSLDLQKQNVNLAEDVFRVSRLKYEQGVGSNLEVLDAETSLREAQTNYYNALFDALVAKVDFEKAKGTLIK
jgi:outer membrane protein